VGVASSLAALRKSWTEAQGEGGGNGNANRAALAAVFAIACVAAVDKPIRSHATRAKLRSR